jgi:hypothetical protein
MMRPSLHARIVAVLEALTGGRVAEQVERLAYHALRGEVWEGPGLWLAGGGESHGAVGPP